MNDKKRGRPSKNNTQLNSDAILEVAKKLLLVEKKIPSIRKIALELNIDPMSIYYYFPNKNNLLEAITISLMQEIYEPNNSKNWKEELILLSRSYLFLLSNYPGLLEIMLKMESQGPANEFFSRLERVLLPLKLDEKEIDSVLCLLVDYLHGVALAIQCDSKNQLSIDTIENPLNLIIKSIDNIKSNI